VVPKLAGRLRGLRFGDQKYLSGASPFGAIENGAFLDCRDAARNGDHDAWTQSAAAADRFLDKIPQHGFAQFEIGNHSVAQRPHGGDRVGRSAQHLPRQLPDSGPPPENFASSFFKGHDRRLIQHDPSSLDGHQRVGGSQVDRQVGT
jgi:hypothetical protein